jgi:hypothetical protein
MRRRERGGAFKSWLAERPGYVLPSWVHHLTGVSKAALSKAVAEGRIRAERFTFPDGKVLTLIFLPDALRVDVYRRGPGWAEDVDDVAPPSHRKPRLRPKHPPSARRAQAGDKPP